MELIIVLALCAVAVYAYYSRNKQTNKPQGISPIKDVNTTAAPPEDRQPTPVPDPLKRQPSTKRTRWRGFRTNIAGITYHDAFTVMHRLKAGDTVSLVREPDNVYDSNAIKVMFDKYFLGYVPSDHAPKVAESLDSGEGVSAEVVQVYTGHNDYREIYIYIKTSPQL